MARLFKGFTGKRGEIPSSAPEGPHIEPFKPEVPKALTRTKFAALIVAGLAEVAEIMIKRNQAEAYYEARFTVGLYEGAIEKPASLQVAGREKPLETSVADKSALLYADSIVNSVVGQNAEAQTQSLLDNAKKLVAMSHNDPTLRTRLLGVATKEWRVIAEREIHESAEDLSETPIDKAKKALDANTTGRLPDEHRKRLIGTLPTAARLFAQGLSTIAPGARIIEHAVTEVAESLTENPELVTRILHRQDTLGQYLTGQAPERNLYLGQLQQMAHERGIEVADGAQLDTFAKLIAATTLLDQTESFVSNQGIINVPEELAELSRYASLAGVLDSRQSALRSQTDTETEEVTLRR